MGQLPKFNTENEDLNCMEIKMLFQKEAYSIALKLQFTLFEIEHVYCLVKAFLSGLSTYKTYMRH